MPPSNLHTAGVGLQAPAVTASKLQAVKASLADFKSELNTVTKRGADKAAIAGYDKIYSSEVEAEYREALQQYEEMKKRAERQKQSIEDAISLCKEAIDDGSIDFDKILASSAPKDSPDMVFLLHLLLVKVAGNLDTVRSMSKEHMAILYNEELAATTRAAQPALSQEDVQGMLDRVEAATQEAGRSTMHDPSTENLKADLKSAEHRNTSLTRDLHATTERVEQLELENQRLEQRNGTLDHQNAELSTENESLLDELRSDNRHVQLKEEIANLQRELREKVDAAENDATARALEARQTKIVNDFAWDLAQQDQTELETKVRNLNSTIKALRRSESSREQRISNLENALDEARQFIRAEESHARKLEEADKRNKALAEANKLLTASNAKLAREKQSARANRDSFKDALHELSEKYKAQNTKGHAAASDASRFHEQSVELLAEKNDLLAKLGSVREERDEYESKLEKTQKDLVAAEIEHAEQAQQIASLRQQSSNLEKKLGETTEQLNNTQGRLDQKQASHSQALLCLDAARAAQLRMSDRACRRAQRASVSMELEAIKINSHLEQSRRARDESESAARSEIGRQAKLLDAQIQISEQLTSEKAEAERDLAAKTSELSQQETLLNNARATSARLSVEKSTVQHRLRETEHQMTDRAGQLRTEKDTSARLSRQNADLLLTITMLESKSKDQASLLNTEKEASARLSKETRERETGLQTEIETLKSKVDETSRTISQLRSRADEGWKKVDEVRDVLIKTMMRIASSQDVRDPWFRLEQKMEQLAGVDSNTLQAHGDHAVPWRMLPPWCRGDHSDIPLEPTHSSDVITWRLLDVISTGRQFTAAAFGYLSWLHEARRAPAPEVDACVFDTYVEAILQPNCQSETAGGISLAISTLAMWQLLQVRRKQWPQHRELYRASEQAMESYLVKHGPSLMKRFFHAVELDSAVEALWRAHGLACDDQNIALVSKPEFSWILVLDLGARTWRVVSCTRAGFGPTMKDFCLSAAAGCKDSDLCLTVKTIQDVSWIGHNILKPASHIELLDSER